MPVTPTYPGVYIEEIPSGVRTITGVSTSIAAFLGRTAKGPLNKAVRCFNHSDFIRAFGGAHPSSHLAQSVKLFFNNGGAECYIVRLAHEARKASLTLKNLIDNNVMVATAKNEGVWGNAIKLEVDYDTPNPDDSFNLTVKYEESGRVIEQDPPFTNLSMDPNSPRYAPSFVSQSSKIIDLKLVTGFNHETDAEDGHSESRRSISTHHGATLHTDMNALLAGTGKFELSVNGAQFVLIDLSGLTISHTVNEDYSEEVVEALVQEINTQLGAAITGMMIDCEWIDVHDYMKVLRITSDSGDKSSVLIRRSPDKDLAGPLMLGIDQGGIEVTRYSYNRPVPTATMYTGDINTLAALAQGDFDKIEFVGASDPVDFGAKLQTTLTTELWYKDSLPESVNDHNDGVREKLRIIAESVNDEADLPCKAEVWGYHLAFIPTTGTINHTIDFTTGKSAGGGENIGSEGLDLFDENVRQYALGATGTSSFQDNAGTIGRDDDGNPPNTADYVGSLNQHTGLHALDLVDIFNLLILPWDESVDLSSIWSPASIYCEKQRAFLLIDAPTSWSRDGRPVVVQENSLVGELRAKVINKNSAVFYPQLRTRANGLEKSIGSSGAIAGLMARTDTERGVWKAPAGTEADLRGIMGLDIKLTDMENGVLNKLGVNCARAFPGTFVNWGARTMDGSDDIGSEWKYIPIRRLALFLEESLFRGTKWVVFEPNDEPLWAKIRLNVGAFMMRLFRQGAFQGSTPSQAYYVKCDSETTPQADRDLGIVNIEVGFAPLKPAEFVIIKIQQIAGEL